MQCNLAAAAVPAHAARRSSNAATAAVYRSRGDVIQTSIVTTRRTKTIAVSRTLTS